MKPILSDAMIEAIQNRKASKGIDPWLNSYITRGRTYVLASNGRQADDQKEHDLIAITRFGRAIALSEVVDPMLVKEVQKAADNG